MANKLSSKKSLYGNRVSHSQRKIRHAQKPNFQNMKLDNGETVVLTAREIRTFKKQTADSKKEVVETTM